MSYVSNLVIWFKKRPAYAWFYAVGVVVLLASGLFWWSNVQTQPERVFHDMLEQSMATNGVTVQASQGGNGSNIDYTLQYSLGADNKARSLTVIEQPGSKVTTETIGTPKADFTRYKDVEFDQPEGGEAVDVDNIKGIWAKADSDQGGLLAQAVLGLSLPLGALPVPIANLQPEDRQKLLDQIQNENVYGIDYDDVEENREGGRLLYTYKAKIQVILYAHLMKNFAQTVGLDEFDELDPNQYSGTPPLELELTVDVRSRHLTKVEIADPEGNPPYVQTFSAYDVPVTADVPETDTITSAELQKRLQEL